MSPETTVEYQCCIIDVELQVHFNSAGALPGKIGEILFEENYS